MKPTKKRRRNGKISLVIFTVIDIFIIIYVMRFLVLTMSIKFYRYKSQHTTVKSWQAASIATALFVIINANKLKIAWIKKRNQKIVEKIGHDEIWWANIWQIFILWPVTINFFFSRSCLLFVLMWRSSELLFDKFFDMN